MIRVEIEVENLTMLAQELRDMLAVLEPDVDEVETIDPPEPAEPINISQNKKVTLPMIRKALGGFIERHSEPEGVALLAEHGGGATYLSELKKEYYPAVYKAADHG